MQTRARAGRAGAAFSVRLHQPRVGGTGVFLMQLDEVLAHAAVGISGLSSCPPALSLRSHPLQSTVPLSPVLKCVQESHRPLPNLVLCSAAVVLPLNSRNQEDCA